MRKCLWEDDWQGKRWRIPLALLLPNTYTHAGIFCWVAYEQKRDAADGDISFLPELAR
jgi:hypothetical protein